MEYETLDLAKGSEAVERRMGARLAVSSLIFVKLGDVNGGIAFNISEDGLALSAANGLPEGQIPELVIQLPDSGDWIRTSGQIKWRSKSNKECGVRYFGLSEEAQRRIREWIAAETSSVSPNPEPETNWGFQNVELDSTVPAPGETLVSIGKEDIGTEGIGTEGIGKEDKEASDADPAAEIGGHGTLQEKWPESEPARDTGATVFTEGFAKEEKDEDKIVAERRMLPAPVFCLNPNYAEAVLDRRVHPRKRIIPLGYVQLGDENGGIALNLSEGGLSVTAANPLPQDHLPSIRLQSPDSTRSVDAKGKIVWRSESKKEAGVRFVELTEEARLELRNWLSSPVPPLVVEPQPEPTLRTKKNELHLAALSAREFLGQGPIPDSALSGKVPVEISPDVSSLPAATPRAESHTPSEMVKRQLGVVRVRIKGRVQAWTAAVAVLMLVGLAPFFREWLSSRPRGTKRMVEVIVPKQPVQSEVAEVAPQLPAANSKNASQPPRPDRGQKPNGKNRPSEIMPTTPFREVPRRVGGALLSLAAKPPKERGRDMQVSPGSNQVNTEFSASPVSVTNPTLPGEQPRVSAPRTPWPQEEARLSPALIPIVSPPSKAEVTEPPKNGTEFGVEVPSLPKRTEPAMRINGTVTITTDPYPSIRFSGKANGKKSRGGASLRLGQLLSRVDPPYPEEAMQKGVQGTVKIHVIVTPQGTIGRMVSVDGPPLLVPATVGAVEQWRYSQTLLAGQPVETEDNIAVTFGLSTGGNR